MSSLDLINPATEQVHASVPHASAVEVDDAVRRADSAFRNVWSRLTATERGRLMFRLADKLDQHMDELARLDSEDMGKPYKHARENDVPTAIGYLRFYAGYCDKIRGSQVPCDPTKHVYLIREPLGVVAGIIPWNFPFVIAMQKLAPALACGNAVVLKPAEQSPRSAMLLAELAAEAGLPEGVMSTITGLSETTGDALASHVLVRKISFTGSTEVGKIIMRRAAEGIKKVTLELGGKTANIIFDDAGIDAAVASTIFTSCYNSGQICTSGSRLLLNRRIHDQFFDALSWKLNALRVGDPADPAAKLGPLVSRVQYDRVQSYIELGSREYSPIVCGQRAANLTRGYYVNPTLFDHVDPASRIAQEEIFGPVVSIIDFESEEEAIAIANQTSYGLATGIWTRDLARAHRVAAAVDSGLVWVNCNHYGVAAIPYEGHRQSGIGVDMGLEVVESYTKMKSVVVNLDPAPNPWALG
jgi:acyl-CoA reductase-like NAD-dependent aldehyde dehydrogenase